MDMINYHDAMLYRSDVDLLGPSMWLNDNCITFALRYLEHEVLKTAPMVSKSVCFIDAAVMSCMMLQMDEEDELLLLRDGLGIMEKSIAFLPVNDNEGFFQGSSHWSLLCIVPSTSTTSGGSPPTFGESTSFKYFHFDSSSGHNNEAAEKAAAQVNVLLGLGRTVAPASVHHVTGSPQQKNGYDCGVYTVLVAGELAQHFVLDSCILSEETMRDVTWALRSTLTETSVTKGRQDLQAFARSQFK